MISWMHAILKSCTKLAMDYKEMVTARPVFIVKLISGPPIGNQTPTFSQSATSTTASGPVF